MLRLTTLFVVIFRAEVPVIIFFSVSCIIPPIFDFFYLAYRHPSFHCIPVRKKRRTILGTHKLFSQLILPSGPTVIHHEYMYFYPKKGRSYAVALRCVALRCVALRNRKPFCHACHPLSHVFLIHFATINLVNQLSNH